jgi:uncharacterized protein (DUF302 family)
MPPPLAALADDAPRVASYTHGDDTLTLVCADPFETVALRLQASLAANGLRVDHVHRFDDLAAPCCRVYEVGTGTLAAQLLALDPALAHLLPWRIALHGDRCAAMVTTPRPVVLMAEFSPLPAVARLARVLEGRLQRTLHGCTRDEPGASDARAARVPAAGRQRPLPGRLRTG